MSEDDKSLYMRFGSQGQLDNRQAVSEWYYLRPLRKNNIVIGLAIGVNSASHEAVCEVFCDQSAGVARTAEDLQVELLSPARSDVWGFGPIFNTVKAENGFIEYHVEISSPSSVISEVLSMVFSILNFAVTIDEESNVNQQAMIETIGTGNGMSAKGISALIGPVWRNWLIHNEQRHHQDIPKAMFEMFNSVASKYPAKLYEFRIWTDKDRFGLSVPGNCACFGVDGTQSRRYDGEHTVYQVSPHNMDNLYQQFSILAGFAQMWEMVRNTHIWDLETQRPRE